MSRKHAWRDSDIENLVAIKRADLSLFNDGSHIPKDILSFFMNWLNVDSFIKGDKQKIKLIFDDFVAEAQIINQNIKSNREIIQIRYNSDVANYLKEMMKESYDIITNDKNNDIEITQALKFNYGKNKNVFRVKVIDLKGESKLTVNEKGTDYVVDDVIQRIHRYISSQGYFYSLDTIKNLYLSLKTKPFVILAGISGTGKSKLVELFAESVGSDRENKRYSLIPVKPDWSDGTDLLGFKNIEGKFLRGTFTTIVKSAIGNPTKPHFICLDEMNLARVEYYFSDILSIMETRKNIKGNIITEKLFKSEDFGEDIESRNELKDLYIPNNLYIIGTVNMDETTFPFSKKVLDRASTIEFNQVNLEIDLDSVAIEKNEIKSSDINNNIFASKYIKIIDCIEEKDVVNKTIKVLQNINNILEEQNMHFGYRVRDEICFYVIYAVREKLMNFEEALDYAILQKILPKIQGSSLSIKTLLLNIFNILNKESIKSDIYDSDISTKVEKTLNNGTTNYLLTSRKIYKMIRRHELDGFTTFWE